MEKAKLPYLNYWKRKDILNKNIQIKTVDFWVNETDSPLEKYIFETLLKSKSVLDYGAGDKWVKSRLKDLKYYGEYFSQDIGEEYTYTYKEISEIKQKFETILLLDVIEHMHLADGLDLCLQLIELLEQNGTLIIQTPNARSIRNHLGSDMTHIQLYSAKDLFAFFTALDLSVEAKRVCLKKRNSSITDKICALFSKIITTQILGVDYTDNIILKITKN